MTAIALIIIFLLLCGFYAGSETALISINRIRLKHWVKQQVRGAKGVEDFLNQPDKALSTTLVSNNVMLVACSSVASVYVAKLFGKGNPYIELNIELTTLLLVALLVLVEIASKTLFREHADILGLRIVPFLRLSYYIFIPLIELTRFISNLLLRAMGVPDRREFLPITKQDMDIMFEVGEREGVLGGEERGFITSVFEFGKTPVREVMVPRTEIVAIKKGTSVKEAIDLIIATGYSRIPIYEGSIDNIKGIVHAFDLLGVSNLSVKVNGLMRAVPYVPEMKRCDEVFAQLRREKNYMAIVLDEYGGTAGLVTIEDLLEELVGHIYDEYDSDQKRYYQLDERVYLIDARAEIEEVNEDLGLNIPAGDYETVGGFVIKNLGRIPEAGEQINLNGLKMMVLEASATRVKKVKVIAPREGE